MLTTAIPESRQHSVGLPVLEKYVTAIDVTAEGKVLRQARSGPIEVVEVYMWQ